MGQKPFQGRYVSPVDLGSHIIADAVSEFTDHHKNVLIDLSLSDGYVDLVGQGMILPFVLEMPWDSSLRIRIWENSNVFFAQHQII